MPGKWERTPDLWEQVQVYWRPSAGTSLLEQPEWLVTNGLGGFACGTVLGPASRRYHGWLIASLAPPVDRRLLWAGTEEWLETAAGPRPLSCHDYGGLLHPDGWRWLASWRLYPFPTWLWSVDGALVERTLFMVRGHNATVARYRLLAGPAVELVLKPFINCRDYHHTVRETGWEFRQETLPHATLVAAYSGAPPLVLAAGSGAGSAGRHTVRYDSGGLWYYNFHYAWEAERGLDHVEDHFCPGTFRIRLAGGGDTAVLVGFCPRPDPQDAPGDGTPAPPWRDGPEALFVWAEAAYQAAADRRRRLVAAAPCQDPDWRRLVLAADDFVAWRRTTRAATLIAGYPWFTDWGRDAMISLPGLLLCTGRHAEAREVLLTFAAHRWEGLVPNRFADLAEGEPAAYNAADAPLWFVYAVWKYWCATGDAVTVNAELLPATVDVLEHYLRGTSYGIGVGPDGLVYAGQPGVQLTWMDAKVGDWVVTPRMGAAVEINALWYNALRVVETLAGRCGRPDASQWGRLARSAHRSFLRRFAHPEGWLRDVVQERNSGDWIHPEARAQADPARLPGSAHEALRPNQLLALALPFPVVGRRRGRAVLQRVARELLTPVGLRTLAPGDPEYRGRYTGDQWQRDAAYHQGTVWPWLLGPFISGFLRCCGRTPETVAAARAFLDPLRRHLRCEGALGQVSEIFDGDPPHGPRGCFAQAWSVAEWLRVWAEELEVADDRAGVHGDRVRDGLPGRRPR